MTAGYGVSCMQANCSNLALFCFLTLILIIAVLCAVVINTGQTIVSCKEGSASFSLKIFFDI